MPITVNTIVENLKSSTSLTTLGRQSTFRVIINDKSVAIVNSRKRELVLTDDHVAEVDARYNKLLKLGNNEHLKTSRYNSPKWAEAPNLIFSPYLARIIHFIHSGE